MTLSEIPNESGFYMELTCIPGSDGYNAYDEISEEVKDDADLFDPLDNVKRNPLLLYLIVYKDYILA